MRNWTRRGFIGAGVVTGGALIVGVAVRPGNPVDRLKPLVASGEGEALVNSWVRIDPDNAVTAIVPHCEMGQGVHSVLAQMLADELDADWETIRVMEAPNTDDYVNQHAARLFVAPGVGGPDWLEPTIDGVFTKLAQFADARVTGGSSSIRSTGQKGLRLAGAAAREMLVAAAARDWGVDKRAVRTAGGMLYHDKTNRSARYADFAEAASKESMPTAPRLKQPAEYRLMGKSKPRTDIPAKVNGSAKFGIDAMPEGVELKYAALKAPPVPGAKVVSMNAERAKAMPGVIQILNMGDFVAVVADGYWQAQQALDTIEAEYSKTDNDTLDQDGLYARFGEALDKAGAEGGDGYFSQGDALTALGGAAKKVDVEYRVPFLAHSPMEPVNCTAWARDGKCDVWTSTQVPLMARAAISKAIGMPESAITIHTMYLGGAFGRRLETDYAVAGARVARFSGYPVKTIYSREEDTRHSGYRPSTISRFRGALDASGKPTALDHIYLFKNDPAGAANLDFYEIPNQSIRTLNDVDMHLRFLAWRSVDHSQLGFFNESFMDEMAHAAGKDPYEFRLSLLGKSPRHAAVLTRAAQMANWGDPISQGHGKGIALVPAFGTIVAEVVEVDMTGGKPKVVKVWCCADPGYAMNPDGFTAQMEGGIIFGLSAAMYGAITLKDGGVEQSNFHDYKILRINEAPEIEVDIINGDPTVLGGAGEPGLPPLAPALANAIFAATGQRIRELPIEKHKFV